MIVVDTNVVAYLLLQGPQTAAAEALLEAHPTWAAPPLWRSEWRNVLCGYLRRGSLSLEQVIALQEQAEQVYQGIGNAEFLWSLHDGRGAVDGDGDAGDAFAV